MDNHVDLAVEPAYIAEPDNPSWSCYDGLERQCTDEEPCKYHDARPQFFSAAIFLMDRAFGGPEEGGWWYTTGEPSREAEHAVLTRVFASSEAAWAYARDTLAPVCEKANEGRRSMYSVLSDGEYSHHIQRGYPTAFPERRPHYE